MAKKEVDNHSNQFKEHLAGFFHEMFHAAGITMMPQKSTERIRSVGERMAITIEHAAERKSIEVIKKLQKAVLSAFNKVEEVLKELRELVNTLVADHKTLAESEALLEEKLNDLESRLQAIETTHIRCNDLQHFSNKLMGVEEDK